MTKISRTVRKTAGDVVDGDIIVASGFKGESTATTRKPITVQLVSDEGGTFVKFLLADGEYEPFERDEPVTVLTMVTLTLKIVNYYPSLETTTTCEVRVPLPPEQILPEYHDWAKKYLFPQTAGGTDEDVSWSMVMITNSTDPSLVGRTYEFDEGYKLDEGQKPTP